MSDELCTVTVAEDNVDVHGDFPCVQLIHQWLRSLGTEEPNTALVTSRRTTVAVNSIRALLGFYQHKLPEPTLQDDTHVCLRRRLRNARAYLQEQLLRHRHLYTFLQEIKHTRPKAVSTWLAFRHYNYFVFRNFLRPDPMVNTEELPHVFLLKLEDVVNALTKEDKTQFYVRIVVLLREYVDIAVENYVNYVDPCDKNRHSSYMACLLSYYSAFISATLKLYDVLAEFSEFISERFRMNWYLFNQRIFYQYFYLRPEVQVRVPEFYQMYKKRRQPGLINLLRSYTLFVENMNRLDNHWQIQRKRIDIINDRNMVAETKWVERDWMMYEEVRRISSTNYWLVRSEKDKAIQDMEELDSHILEMLCSSWDTGDRVVTLTGTCICEDCMLVEFCQMILPPNHRLRNNSRCTRLIQGESALYEIPAPVKEVLAARYERPVVRLTMCSICEETVLLNAYSKHIVSNHPPTDEEIRAAKDAVCPNSGERIKEADPKHGIHKKTKKKRTSEEACIDNHTSLIVVDKKLKSTNFVAVPMDSPQVQCISSESEENKLVQIALPPSLASSVKALYGMSRCARYIESTVNDQAEDQQNKNSVEDQSRDKLFSINPPLHKHVLPDKCSICLQKNDLLNNTCHGEGIKNLHCFQCCKVKEPSIITLFPTDRISTLDTNLRPYSTLTTSSYSSSPSERDENYDSDSTNSEMIVILKNHKDCDQPNNHDVHIKRVTHIPRKDGLQFNMNIDADSTQSLATEVVDAALLNGLQPMAINTIQRNSTNKISFETFVAPPSDPAVSPNILEEHAESSSDGGPEYIDLSDEDYEIPTQEPKRLLPEMKSASLSDDDLREVEPFRPDSCWKLVYPDLELEPDPPCPFLEEMDAPDLGDLSGTVIIPGPDGELKYQYLQSRANVCSPEEVRLCAPSVRLDANGAAPGFWLSNLIADQLTSYEIGEDIDELLVDADEDHNSTLPDFPNQDSIEHSDGLDDCSRLFQAFVRDADRTNKITQNRYLAQRTHFSNAISDDIFFQDVDSNDEIRDISQSLRNARTAERLSEVWGDVDGRWESMEEIFRTVTPVLVTNFNEVVLQEVKALRAVTSTVDQQVDEMFPAVNQNVDEINIQEVEVNPTVTANVDYEAHKIFRVVTPTLDEEVREIFGVESPKSDHNEIQGDRRVTPTDHEVDEIFGGVTPTLEDQEVDEILQAVTPTLDDNHDLFTAVTPTLDHNTNEIVLKGVQVFRAITPTIDEEEVAKIFRAATPMVNHNVNEVNIVEEDDEDEVPDYVTEEDLSLVNDEFTKQLMKILQEADGITMLTEDDYKDEHDDKADANSDDQSATNFKMRRHRLKESHEVRLKNEAERAAQRARNLDLARNLNSDVDAVAAAGVTDINYSAEALRSVRATSYHDAAAAASALAAVSQGAGAAAVVALAADRGEQLIVKIAENLGSAGTSLFSSQTATQSTATTSTTFSGKPTTTSGKPAANLCKPPVTVGKPPVTLGKPSANLCKPSVTLGKPPVTSGKPISSASNSSATSTAASGAIPKITSRIYSKRTQLRAARNRELTEPESTDDKQHRLIAEIEKSYNDECQDALVWPIVDKIDSKDMVEDDDLKDEVSLSINLGGQCKVCNKPISTEQHLDCIRAQTSKSLAKALKKKRQKAKRERERNLRQQQSDEMRERQHELVQLKCDLLEQERQDVLMEINRIEDQKRLDREREVARKAAIKAEHQRQIERRQAQSRNDKAREAAKKLAVQQALEALKNKKKTLTKSKKRRTKKAADAAASEDTIEINETIEAPYAPKLPSVDDDNSSYEPWSSDEFMNSDDIRKGFLEEKSDSSDYEAPAQPRPHAQPITEELPAMIRIVRGDAPSTVTISLKGVTPEQDKLLYTLVNGQAELAEPPQELTAAAAAASVAMLPMPDMSVLEDPNLTKKQRKKKTQQLNKKVAKVSAVNASLSQSSEDVNGPVSREAQITQAVDQNLRTVKAGGEVKSVQQHNLPNNEDHATTVGATTIKLPDNFNLPPGITITPVAQPFSAYNTPSQEQSTSTGAIRKPMQVLNATQFRNTSVSIDATTVITCNNNNNSRFDVTQHPSQRPKLQEQPQHPSFFNVNQSPAKIPYVPFYMTQPKTGSPIILDTEKLIKEGAIKKKRKSKKKQPDSAAVVAPAPRRYPRQPRLPRLQVQHPTVTNAQRFAPPVASTPAPVDPGLTAEIQEGKPTDEPKMITLKNPLFQQEPLPPFAQPTEGMQPLEQSQQDQLSVQLSEQATIYKGENGMVTIRRPGLPVSDNIGETISMTAFLREQQPERQPARDWNTYSLFSNPTPCIPPDIDIVDVVPNLNNSTTANRPAFGGNVHNYQPNDLRAIEPHPWMNLLSTLPEEIEVTTVEKPGPSSYQRNLEMQPGPRGLQQFDAAFNHSDYRCSNDSLFNDGTFGSQYDTASQLPAQALDRSALNIPDVTLFNSSGLGMPLNDIMPQYTDTTALEQALAMLNVAVAPDANINVMNARAHAPNVSALAHHPELSYHRVAPAQPLRLNQGQPRLNPQASRYPIHTMPVQNLAQSLPSMSASMSLYNNEEPQYDWLNQVPGPSHVDANAANTNQRSIWHEDNVFAPKESFDDGELDPIDRDVEAFKLFCLQSIPPEKKEKVMHLNVHDIVLKSKNKK